MRLLRNFTTMSTSSRWKRFAFFERKNLSLPPSIVKDLIPTKNPSRGGGGERSKNNGGSGAGAGSESGNNNENDLLDPKHLYRSNHNVKNENNNEEDEEESTVVDCYKIGCGEYFCLVAASNVSLPPFLFGGDKDGGDDLNFAMEDSNALVDMKVSAMRRGAGGDGASAMNAGLVALQTAAKKNISGQQQRGKLINVAVDAMERGGVGDGKLQLLFISSRNTSLVHCVDVTVRCTPANSLFMAGDQNQQMALSSPSNDSDNSDAFTRGRYNNKNKSNNITNIDINNNAFAFPNTSDKNNSIKHASNIMTNPEELDGWRGHYDPFTSCDGFISPSIKNSAVLATSSLSKPPRTIAANAATKVGTRRKTSAEQQILDEHLGVGEGRGNDTASLFGSSPFASDYFFEILQHQQQQQKQPSPMVQREKARIVGLATTSCSIYPSSSPPPPANEHLSQSQYRSFLSSILYVAAITDAPGTVGVVVHANPHLMLSSSLPSSTTTTTSTSADTTLRNFFSWYYKPLTFNFENHGKPRCVSILPGVVCVGTDTGIVLVYVFPINRPGHAGGNGGSSSAGNNGRRLSLVAEIPAPQGNSIDDGKKKKKKMYSASSVHLIGPSDSSSFILEDGGSTTVATGTSLFCSGDSGNSIYRLFVSYRRRIILSTTTHVREGGLSSSSSSSPSLSSPGGVEGNNQSSTSSTGGVCCYDLGGLRIPGNSLAAALGMGAPSANAPVVSARYDMDGRDVGSSCFCDGVSLPPLPLSALWTMTTPKNYAKKSGEDGKSSPFTENKTTMEKMLPRYAVSRIDGLHLYSPQEKVGVCPIDGNKIAMCSLPLPPMVYLRRPVRRPPSTTAPPGDCANTCSSGVGLSSFVERNCDCTAYGAGASYTLVATTDSKSGRDAIDIYDTTNKLVGFHVLLSPGHRALRAVGVFSSPVVGSRTLLWGGRSSAVVLTSGGSIVTLTERVTPEKIDLLTQKNLFQAAISMAFSDPQFFCPEDIISLYRRYAEHLYRKGDFSAAMDQYILTIGSLESSHVIFRFLDAPKIFLTVKYLVSLRVAGLASSMHDDLLRTCYLKLGDVDAASKIILTPSSSSSPCDDVAPFPVNPDGSEVTAVPILRNLLACADDPSEMLSAICSLYPTDAVEALVAHGVLIARSLPRETAGVVIALCEGTYLPSVADSAAGRSLSAGTRSSGEGSGIKLKCEKYPMSLFVNAFMENPKLFRLILSHCRRNGSFLTPMLRRTLLELTLDEWNTGKRMGDVHVQKLRRDEAIMVCNFPLFRYVLHQIFAMHMLNCSLHICMK